MRLLKKESDLSEEEKKIPEKWIKELTACNRMGDIGADDVRGKIWDCVFDHWNTNKKVPQPSKASKRRIADRIVHVGFLTADAPLAKRRGYRNAVVPSQRRARRPVFLKVDTHSTIVVTRDVVSNYYCDAKGSRFPRHIRFDWLPNFTRDIAMQQAISKWDRAELRRIGRANTRLVLYWTRNELLSSLAAEATGAPGAANSPRLPGQRGFETDAEQPKLAYIWLFDDSWKAVLESASAY
ncbi:hypothetical protein CSAL01_09231 [Colletotrichum salicis]|uniref:Uncharacterized protein n=1 Tax=Colletotrichum salicis TaxID=1209931 RepID=A0A135S3N1_9PEZI|nr:hypothetical protein CSAL01_09231 [Colletotrichum salicis]